MVLILLFTAVYRPSSLKDRIKQRFCISHYWRTNETFPLYNNGRIEIEECVHCKKTQLLLLRETEVIVEATVHGNEAKVSPTN